MNLKIEQTGCQAIVYDADSIQHAGPELFDAEFWRQSGAISGSAPGRGRALLLRTAFGPLVMRRYRRGGLATRVSLDRYLFTGFRRSRPVREIKLLAHLCELGLPVPQPLACQCLRRGFSYSGVLLTRRIDSAIPLADLLCSAPAPSLDWPGIGRCNRRFHDCGVHHPDLNARNILLGTQAGAREGFFLIDFDRARMRPHSAYLCRSNLRRLHRSLLRLWPSGRVEELQSCWEQLMQGYNSAA